MSLKINFNNFIKTATTEKWYSDFYATANYDLDKKNNIVFLMKLPTVYKVRDESTYDSITWNKTLSTINGISLSSAKSYNSTYMSLPGDTDITYKVNWTNVLGNSAFTINRTNEIILFYPDDNLSSDLIIVSRFCQILNSGWVDSSKQFELTLYPSSVDEATVGGLIFESVKLEAYPADISCNTALEKLWLNAAPTPRVAYNDYYVSFE